MVVVTLTFSSPYFQTITIADEQKGKKGHYIIYNCKFYICIYKYL